LSILARAAPRFSRYGARQEVPLTISAIQAPIRNELASVSEMLSRTLVPDILDSDTAEKLTSLSGGDLIRPSVLLFSALTGKHPGESAVAMAAGCELFHVATWVHDAVVDGIAVEGWPPEWMVINGDHIFSTALTLLSSGPKDSGDVAARMISTMAKGEISYVRETPETKPEEHVQMVAGKYGSLFEASAELGGLCGDIDSKALTSIKEYGKYLGMGYKIGEEIVDLEESVRRGRMTLSVLYAILKDSEKSTALVNKDFESVREWCDRTGGTETARNDAVKFVERASSALSASGLESEPMRNLCTWVKDRIYP
jgi:geranylgeranyl pyrophosphate synthase